MHHSFSFSTGAWLLTAVMILTLTPTGMAQPTSHTVIHEAEWFEVKQGPWRHMPWGENYYAASFANSFLSRKACLSAPATGDRAVAETRIHIPAPGRYRVLLRYEAAYRFQTQFSVQVEQRGKQAFDRAYGGTTHPKIWAFRKGVVDQVAWPWGASENIVWEGHDAFVELAAGDAVLRLIADDQPEPAARRNIDLVMLTSDDAEVERQLEKARYLPLDGMLTQAGDLYMRVTNHRDDESVTIKAPPGIQHSPYWIHIRSWTAKTIAAAPETTSEWIEVGSLLDTLNDGKWQLTASSESKSVDYSVAFGVPKKDGGFETIATVRSQKPKLELAFDADTRTSRRIRPIERVLYDLLDQMEAMPAPRGRPPVKTPVFYETFARQPDNARYTAARNRFIDLMGLSYGQRGVNGERSDGDAYIDLRHLRKLDELETELKRLTDVGRAEAILSVSLGDEIGLPQPPAADADALFRAWLANQPVDVSDWGTIRYQPKPESAEPRMFYWSLRFRHDYGINALRPRTELIHRYLPNAHVGANFSPHHGVHYIGETYKWVHLFRRGGMTMPWSEDYIWQIPVGSQQVNFLNLALCRAGLRDHPERPIHYYVMAHSPGNTPASWRRMFYGTLAHGARRIDLYELRPVQAAYTENYVNDPASYQAVRVALHELGLFEDIVQSGAVQPARVALWFSETADIWRDGQPPFGAALRTLYVALRQQQVAVDIVTESDATAGHLDGVKTIWLTQRHVSRQATAALAAWVRQGGTLITTAGAGLYDEYDHPNDAFAQLLGIQERKLDTPEDQQVKFEKQDLPFIEPMDRVGISDKVLPVIGAAERFKVTTAKPIDRFEDNRPATTHRALDLGHVHHIGLLPGLSYFKPAIPLQPVDRGNTDSAMAHLIPTKFDAATRALLSRLTETIERPVVCSSPLVETTTIRADGATAVFLINWSPQPAASLKVTLHTDVPTGSVTLASGGPITTQREDDRLIITCDLAVADALIFR